MATPLEIQIALHYHCCIGTTDFRDLTAPPIASAIHTLEQKGLIKRIPECCRPTGGARYQRTEALAVYVTALCSMPPPVQRWVMEQPVQTVTQTRVLWPERNGADQPPGIIRYID